MHVKKILFITLYHQDINKFATLMQKKTVQMSYLRALTKIYVFKLTFLKEPL